MEIPQQVLRDILQIDLEIKENAILRSLPA